MDISLYDQSGTLRFSVRPDDGSSQQKEIQGDNILSLSFSLYEHVSLDVNDYVDYEGERYWLMDAFQPVMKGRHEWRYELKLYGVESLLKRFLVLNTTDGDSEPVFTLTAPASEHLRLIVSCINAGMGTSDFKVGAVSGSENIVMDYEGTYCDEALRELADKCGVEWWIEGQTVNLSRCEHGEQMELGYGSGLASLERDTADTDKFYSRLYPIGSTRNIDAEKYGYPRLMLPGGKKYVDVSVDQYGVIDHYEADAFAGIYPRRVGTLSSVRSEEVKDDDGNPYKIYYVKDGDLPFNPDDYMLSGKVLRISFQEGSELAGLGDEEDGTYYFECNYNAVTGEFELITLWPYDDDTQLPNDTLCPKVGDQYILWNMAMPDEYYTLAEEELAAAVDEYNAEHALDISVYKGQTDHVWVEDNGAELYVGRLVRLVSAEYFPDDGYRDSRITKLTRRVNLPGLVDLEISDALSTGSLSKLTASVSEARSYARSLFGSATLPDIIRTGEKTKPTDTNLYSARRTHQEFLSKKDADTAQGVITFLKGLRLVDGTWYIDEEAAAYLHSLKLDEGIEAGGSVTVGGGLSVSGDTVVKALTARSITTDTLRVLKDMHVFQLIVDEIKGESGMSISSAARMVVDAVEEIDGGWRCWQLSEGDRGKITNKWIAGDQAICWASNLQTGSSVDVGTQYYWRLVFATGSGTFTDSDGAEHAGIYIDLSAKEYDRSASNSAPLVGDEIAQLGYRWPTDTTAKALRTAARISYTNFTLESSMEEKCPYVAFYKGIRDFSLTDCRQSWFGWNDLELKGNVALNPDSGLSDYINSLIEEATESADSYSADLTTYADVVTIDDDGNCIEGLWAEVDGWKQYRIHSALSVRKGGIILTEAPDGSTPGKGEYAVGSLVSSSSEWVYSNGAVSLKGIDNVRDGVASTSEDIDYGAMRAMNECSVTLVVNCENKCFLTKRIPVKIVHSSEPFVGADLTNEHTGISWNTREQKYIGVPAQTTLRMWKNSTPLALTGISCSAVGSDGSTAVDATAVGDVDSGLVSLTYVSPAITGEFFIKINASVTYAGVSYERTQLWSITKSVDTAVYELMPSCDQILINGNGKVVVGTSSGGGSKDVSCGVLQTSYDESSGGSTTQEIAFGDLSKYGLTMKYGLDDSEELTVWDGNPVSVSSKHSRLTFYLYDASGVLIDRESVPVICYGVDGKDVEFIFVVSSSSELVYDDTLVDPSTLDAVQETDYVPTGWYDNEQRVTEVKPFGFMSKRTSNGGVWGKFSAPVCVSHYGSDGSSPYLVDLTNENTMVLADASGNVTSGYETTELIVWKGGTDITDTCSVEIAATGISASYDADSHKISVSDMSASADSASVVATVTYEGAVIGTTTYYVVKSRSSVAYRLKTSLSVLHATADGTLASNSKTIAVWVEKVERTGHTELTTIGAIIGEKIDLKIGGNNVKSSEDISNISVAPLLDNGALIVEIYDSAGILIDKETVMVAYDGEEGRGVKSVDTYYIVAQSKPAWSKDCEKDWSTDAESLVMKQGYNVWRAEKMTYTDGTEDYPASSVSMVGECDLLATIVEKYGCSTSESSEPGTWYDADAWAEQSKPEGYWLWSCDEVTYQKGATLTLNKHCIGYVGKDGTSVEIDSTEVMYAVGTESAATGEWKSSVPDVPQGSWLWTRTTVNYTDGKSTTTYSKTYIAKDGEGEDGLTVVATPSALVFESSSDDGSISEKKTVTVKLLRGSEKVKIASASVVTCTNIAATGVSASASETTGIATVTLKGGSISYSKTQITNSDGSTSDIYLPSPSGSVVVSVATADGMEMSVTISFSTSVTVVQTAILKEQNKISLSVWKSKRYTNLIPRSLIGGSPYELERKVRVRSGGSYLFRICMASKGSSLSVSIGSTTLSLSWASGTDDDGNTVWYGTAEYSYGSGSTTVEETQTLSIDNGAEYTIYWMQLEAGALSPWGWSSEDYLESGFTNYISAPLAKDATPYAAYVIMDVKPSKSVSYIDLYLTAARNSSGLPAYLYIEGRGVITSGTYNSSSKYYRFSVSLSSGSSYRLIFMNNPLDTVKSVKVGSTEYTSGFTTLTSSTPTVSDDTFGTVALGGYGTEELWPARFALLSTYGGLVGQEVTFFVIAKQLTNESDDNFSVSGSTSERTLKSDECQSLELDDEWRLYYVDHTVGSGGITSAADWFGIMRAKGMWMFAMAGIVKGGLPCTDLILGVRKELATGINIQLGLITLTADNIVFRTNTGEQTASVDAKFFRIKNLLVEGSLTMRSTDSTDSVIVVAPATSSAVTVCTETIVSGESYGVPALVVLPMLEDCIMGKLSCGTYATSGTKVSIRVRPNSLCDMWPLLTNTGHSSMTQTLNECSALVCADARMLMKTPPNSLGRTGIYPYASGSQRYLQGRIFWRGCAVRYVMLLPGQTLNLISRVEKWIPPTDVDNPVEFLCWDVENAAEFENVAKSVVFNTSEDPDDFGTGDIVDADDDDTVVPFSPTSSFTSITGSDSYYEPLLAPKQLGEKFSGYSSRGQTFSPLILWDSNGTPRIFIHRDT